METLIFPENLSKGVKAFFTGKKPGDDPERLSEISSFKKQKMYMPIQRHTDKVLVLDSDLDSKIADAVITNRNDILIGVQTADCVPILLYDRRKRLIGAVHAGWRGTAKEVLKKAIRTMSDKVYSSPSDISIAMGPSIRWCCYDVGHEVIKAVTKATGEGDYFMKKGEKYCLDLSTANKYQAISMGVLSKNIWMSDDCTFCFPERYYSYRYAKGPTGRQGGFIGIV